MEDMCIIAGAAPHVLKQVFIMNRSTLLKVFVSSRRLPFQDLRLTQFAISLKDIFF